MELSILFDPSIGSCNMGDSVIFKSARKELEPIVDGCLVMRCSTHQPVATWYQNSGMNPRTRRFDGAKYKFVCGSNLLWRRMFKPQPSWNISLVNNRPYRGCILVGVGTHKGADSIDWYTKRLYRKVLSTQFAHSVRDEATRELVEELGLRAINTGCPTMWGFTHDFCRQIPSEKSDSVVFTLTDYGTDSSSDKKLIEVLDSNFERVYFWPQGLSDEEYFHAIASPRIKERVTILRPTLESFESVLHSGEIDYVGTRLHAGMFAMQHKVRSIIIAIDNRVRDMQRTYSFASLDREAIEDLSKMINDSWSTTVDIDEYAIERWKGQFLHSSSGMIFEQKTLDEE